ncbi:MAG TPA: response regulator [Clostridia bacterium]|nr:response regulator [Clostridia bacterium]
MSSATAQCVPILVIEDEPSVMAYVRAALERNGYAVAPATSAVQALEMLNTGTFSGVISDMRTPGGKDGADVFSWLELNRPEMARKLIFITGDTVNEETAATLRRTGAPYLEKPFRVQQLIEVVERTIGKTTK